MEKAAKEVVLQSQAQLKDFAEKENVVLDEDRISDAVSKIMHYITKASVTALMILKRKSQLFTEYNI